MVLVLRHVPHEHLGTLAPALRGAGLRYKYLDVWKRKARFPPSSAFRALVVMGGPMGVYEQDRYPFLKKEIALIRRGIAAGKPVLGICLGAQLIAAALGARVHPSARKEIGWHPIELTAAGQKDPLFRGWPRRPGVFQWHGDTFTRPPGTVLLAASPLCRHQAFRYKKNVYGLQFHIEVDAAMVREWLGQPGARREVESAGRGAYRRLAGGLAKRAPRLARLARPMFAVFTSLIGSSRDRRAALAGSGSF